MLKQTLAEKQRQERHKGMWLEREWLLFPSLFFVSKVWLKLLTKYSKLPKITVQYFDTEKLDLKETEMYISGFKAKLKKDTSYKGLWTVSFTLNEM